MEAEGIIIEGALDAAASGYVADSPTVYWGAHAGLQRVAKAGASPEILGDLERPVVELVHDALNLYAVLWLDKTHYRFVRVGKEHGTATTLHQEAGRVRGVALAGTTLVWCNEATGSVMSMSTSGGAPTVVASKQMHLKDVATDGQRAYWSSLQGVMSASLSGGPISTLASADGAIPFVARWLTVHDGTVYWVGEEVGLFAVPASGGDLRVLWTGYPGNPAEHVGGTEPRTVHFLVDDEGIVVADVGDKAALYNVRADGTGGTLLSMLKVRDLRKIVSSGGGIYVFGGSMVERYNRRATP